MLCLFHRPHHTLLTIIGYIQSSKNLKHGIINQYCNVISKSKQQWQMYMHWNNTWTSVSWSLRHHEKSSSICILLAASRIVVGRQDLHTRHKKLITSPGSFKFHSFLLKFECDVLHSPCKILWQLFTVKHPLSSGSQNHESCISRIESGIFLINFISLVTEIEH